MSYEVKDKITYYGIYKPDGELFTIVSRTQDLPLQLANYISWSAAQINELKQQVEELQNELRTTNIK